MGKLSELLAIIIGKLNKAVSTDAQNLSDEERAQAKANLGISESNGGGDWAQNDPDGPGYIENRTHYTAEAEAACIVFAENLKISDLNKYRDGDFWYISHELPCDHREFTLPARGYLVADIDGVEHKAIITTESSGARLWSDADYYLDVLLPYFEDKLGEWVDKLVIKGCIPTDNWQDGKTLTLKVVELVVKQIPMEYLPYTTEVAGVDGPESRKLVTSSAVMSFVDNRYYDLVKRIPTSYSQLEDRPCYHDPEVVSLVAEVCLYNNSRSATIELPMWKYSKYRVGEVDYTLKSYCYGERCYFGNGSLIENTYGDTLEDTGEDFVVYGFYDGDSTTVYSRAEMDGEYFLQIYSVSPDQLKRLDEDLLPEGVIYITDSELQDLNTQLNEGVVVDE